MSNSKRMRICLLLSSLGAAGLVATGLASMAGNKTTVKRDLDKRTVIYYYSYLSEYSGCTDYDLRTSTLETCYS